MFFSSTRVKIRFFPLYTYFLRMCLLVSPYDLMGLFGHCHFLTIKVDVTVIILMRYTALSVNGKSQTDRTFN